MENRSMFRIEYAGRRYECPIGLLTHSESEDLAQTWCKMLQLAMVNTKFPNGDYITLSKTQHKDAVNYRVAETKQTKTLRHKQSSWSAHDDASTFLSSHGINYWEFEEA